MTILYIILSVLGALALTVVLLSVIAPTRVEYTETIDVDAAPKDVYDDIRLQSRLMRWSAWPKETKSQCAVDEGPCGADGTVGARTVFVSKGKVVGHQELTGLVDGQEVAMTLVGPGPPHEPSLRFKIQSLEGQRSRVSLHFINRLPRPFNAIWRFAGLSAWTREMHLKDLAGLKAFAEPPHRDADGNVVGRPPHGDNPYETALPATDAALNTNAVRRAS